MIQMDLNCLDRTEGFNSIKTFVHFCLDWRAAVVQVEEQHKLQRWHLNSWSLYSLQCP